MAVLLPPLTKYFSALSNENWGHMDKTERMILRGYLHNKVKWLCITLVAIIISSYRNESGVQITFFLIT